MNTAEQYTQQWIIIDNKLKALNEQIKELREKRNSLNDNLIKYSINNNNNNNKLKFVNTKVYEPLTFKYLEKSLGEIIKNDLQVKLIVEQLKIRRTYKNVTEIKRILDT
jgi:hypothetical protein